MYYFADSINLKLVQYNSDGSLKQQEDFLNTKEGKGPISLTDE